VGFTDPAIGRSFDSLAAICYNRDMPLNLESIDHIQVTVPGPLEVESLRFYENVLGLERIPKPGALAKNGGAWYRLGPLEVHVSPEDGDQAGGTSKRHVCYIVSDLAAAESELSRQGIAMTPDRQPIPGWARFYIRDPGGNRIEIAQRLEPAREPTQPDEGT
jgi:catechol 2,3-dioxygenase-like lactoylglutathione lyase family enzyme